MDYFFGLKSVMSGSQPEAQPSPDDTVSTKFLFTLTRHLPPSLTNLHIKTIDSLIELCVISTGVETC